MQDLLGGLVRILGPLLVGAVDEHVHEGAGVKEIGE
jgi:hypothetical protein